MSHVVSTLLLRNLDEVFGEIDPARRRAVIDDIFHEDAVFYDPNGGIFRGRDEIDRIAGVIKAAHPDFRYPPLSAPEENLLKRNVGIEIFQLQRTEISHCEKRSPTETLLDSGQ